MKLRLVPSLILAASVALALPSACLSAELWRQEALSLGLTGYLQQATGVNHLTWDPQGWLPKDSAFHGGTLRLRWSADLGRNVRLEVHDRVLWSVSAPPSTQGSLIGVGASRTPKRWLDLEQTLAKGDGFNATHDLDRLQVSIQTGGVDLKIGRQAITWGFASVLPVSDVWVQQSPFELDRVEKRGVDALRALLYPVEDVEVDLVIADRGTWADLSAGARVAYGGQSLEAYVAAAKLWRELWVSVGGMWLVDVYKLRLEVATPWALDDTGSHGRDGLEATRLTLGVDRIGSALTLGVELHYNGPGADGASDYIAAFSSAPIARGTAYVVGRMYGAAFLSWQAGDLWRLSGTVIGNLLDPSALVAVTAQWDVSGSTQLLAAVYGGVGDAPSLGGPSGVGLGSEFGTYGVVGLVQAIVHF